MSQVTVSDPAQYAQAIYELALETWQKDLQAVSLTLSASADLIAQLDDSSRAFEERQKQLDSVLPEISDPVRSFVYTLLKNGHMAMLDRVVTNLTRLAAKGPGLEIATVTTAVELTDDEKKAFIDKLSQKRLSSKSRSLGY